MEKAARIKELTDILNKAAKAYYQDSVEIMSNLEYDSLYDELKALEDETGIVLAKSPTNKVGYEVLSELPKQVHEKPMLSLDKTKDVSVLSEFLSGHEGYLSWKLDGLTIVLSYENGNLNKAVTRGNGTVGEVITANAKTFNNLPLSISFKGSLTLRGEAVITYSEFERINSVRSDETAKYKNPRNLCAGSVRQLDSRITSERNVYFYAFTLVDAKPLQSDSIPDFKDSKHEGMLWLKSLGFDTVESKKVNSESVAQAVREFEEQIPKNDFPSDGLVLTLDEIRYSESLGTTAKFPKDSIAFKWQDETADTTLLDIEWSASRTGLINPIAIFEPVELEGTSVSRASLHNVSILKELKLGIGDTISVYKANMIIPQISENKTKKGGVLIPEKCPVCGAKTVIMEENGTQTLICPNKECPAKQIMHFTHFVSRDCMNIDGLSQMTIEKFIDKGFIKEPSDIFKLERFKDEIVELEGFGLKSYNNIIEAVKAALEVDMANFIYALGIPNVGLSNAKLLVKAFDYDINKIRNAGEEDIVSIYGLGEIIAKSITDFFRDENNSRIVDDLLSVVRFKAAAKVRESKMTGKTFVITGSLDHFSNRNELKSRIEEGGGKVASAVSRNTDYLINNDTASNSSKNKKAKELGVKIISEEMFMEDFL